MSREYTKYYELSIISISVCTNIFALYFYNFIECCTISVFFNISFSVLPELHKEIYTSTMWIDVYIDTFILFID